MISCSMRGDECDCTPSECKAAPVEAPVITIPLPYQFAVMAFGGAVIFFVAFASGYAENKRLEAVGLVNQEVFASWQR